MVRTLFLMRHAKSDWGDPQLADHDRPLNKRGRSAAPKVAAWAIEHFAVPQRIISSTALRARSTAQIMAEQWGMMERVELQERLYLAPPEIYWEALSECPPGDDRLLFVGHNPGISEWASELAGHTVQMPTAAWATFELSVNELRAADASTRARLLHFTLPREL